MPVSIPVSRGGTSAPSVGFASLSANRGGPTQHRDRRATKPGRTREQQQEVREVPKRADTSAQLPLGARLRSSDVQCQFLCMPDVTAVSLAELAQSEQLSQRDDHPTRFDSGAPKDPQHLLRVRCPTQEPPRHLPLHRGLRDLASREGDRRGKNSSHRLTCEPSRRVAGDSEVSGITLRSDWLGVCCRAHR